MTDASMTAIYGRRGTGKTTRVKELLKSHRRVIAFDPIGEYVGDGFTACGWADLGKKMGRHWRTGFKLSYSPQRGAAAEALHELCQYLFSVQGGYRPGAPQIVLVVEEMSLSFPVTRLPANLWGMTEICERGRHVGIGVIGTTQRPATVNTIFRGNCEDTYVFALSWATDVEAVCSMIGRDQRQKLQLLKPHEFLHCQNGQVTPGKNRPLRKKR